MSKIIIYGILPPPYGGNSIHNKRFLNYLKKTAVDFEFIKANQGSSEKVKHLAFRKFVVKQLNIKKRILHITGFGSMKTHLALLILILFFNKTVVVRIANDRFEKNFNDLGFIRKAIARFYFKMVANVIAVNPKSNFLFLNRDKLSFIPSYIPPLEEEVKANNLPDIFVNLRKRHKLLITANAFKLTFHQGKDLYGLDMSVELMRKLTLSGYNNIGFVFVVPEIHHKDYFKMLQQLVVKYNLSDNFCFYSNPISYPAVLKISDIFIRPTFTDGYGISIAEAIWLQVPTIASNACPRPEGALLFENRNIIDLEDKVKDVIDNYDAHKNRIAGITYDDNAKKILEVYKKVLRQ